MAIVRDLFGSWFDVQCYGRDHRIQLDLRSNEPLCGGWEVPCAGPLTLEYDWGLRSLTVSFVWRMYKAVVNAQRELDYVETVYNCESACPRRTCTATSHPHARPHLSHRSTASAQHPRTPSAIR